MTAAGAPPPEQRRLVPRHRGGTAATRAADRWRAAGGGRRGAPTAVGARNAPTRRPRRAPGGDATSVVTPAPLGAAAPWGPSVGTPVVGRVG